METIGKGGGAHDALFPILIFLNSHNSKALLPNQGLIQDIRKGAII